MEYSNYLDAYKNHNSSIEKNLIYENGLSFETNKQHNIMVLVGNGFDIDLLQRLGTKNMLTTYQDFFEKYIYPNKSKILNYENNIFFSELERRWLYVRNNRQYAKSDWADFESWLPELIKRQPNKSLLEKDLNELQYSFSQFLDYVVNEDVKYRVDQIAQFQNNSQESITTKSFEYFLKDLSEDEYSKLMFPKATRHYDVYDFLFVNFNFTTLLDDYIYLGKGQFDRIRDKGDIRNFQFYPNPNSFLSIPGVNSKTSWSSILQANVIHPHGQQSIPRSLLFGSSDEKLTKNRFTSRFNKEYWAQYSINYEKLFGETQLFIIYGSSIGESDRWWWQEICSSLVKGYRNLTSAPELIVYSYKNSFNKDVFLNKYCDSPDKDKIKDKIHIVNYDNSNNNAFLSFTF